MKAHHYFWLSTAAAVVTICLKTLAWQMTGSMGLGSDAMESFVNLAGAIFALWMITVAQLPPDEDHPMGHSKAEYFSSGFEGLLIFGAAGAIIWSSIGRLLHPEPLEQISIGLALSVGASFINLFVALSLKRAAKRFGSMALEGSSRHLMTDVWTSAGVVIGVLLVSVTGWLWLDAAVAIAVGCHILFEGFSLVRVSAHGLMDAALSAEALGTVERTLEGLRTAEIQFKNLRTRRAGARNFVYVDVLVPAHWTIERTHTLADSVERGVAAALPNTVVLTHAEPLPQSSLGPSAEVSGH